jgi:hypothetical protein
MKTINGVDFYTKEDTIYSRGGYLVLDDTLNPCGIFLPAIKGYEEFSVDNLRDTDVKLIKLAENYKSMRDLYDANS